MRVKARTFLTYLLFFQLIPVSPTEFPTLPEIQAWRTEYHRDTVTGCVNLHGHTNTRACNLRLNLT